MQPVLLSRGGAVKPSTARILEIAEAVAVGAAAIFYVVHWWPVPVIGIVVALICVVVSSLPIWAKRFREKRRYAPVLRCLGFGMLLVASLQQGRSGVPFAIGFGILFISAGYGVFDRLRESKP